MGRWWDAQKALRRYHQKKSRMQVSASEDEEVVDHGGVVFRDAPSDPEVSDVEVEEGSDDEIDVGVEEVYQKKKEPKRRHRVYTAEQKEQCLRMKAEGMSTRQISIQLGIPRTNVTDWTRGKSLKKGGRQKLLSDAEEKLIVDHIILRQMMGKGIAPGELAEFVATLLEGDERAENLTDGRPSKLNFILFNFIMFNLNFDIFHVKIW
jgi:DNA-binding transcriptional regulator YiaG